MNRGYWEQREAEDARRREWRLLDEATRLRSRRPGTLRRWLGKALITLGASLAGEPCNAAAS